jgi:hypothetical protein
MLGGEKRISVMLKETILLPRKPGFWENIPNNIKWYTKNLNNTKNKNMNFRYMQSTQVQIFFILFPRQVCVKSPKLNIL